MEVRVEVLSKVANLLPEGTVPKSTQIGNHLRTDEGGVLEVFVGDETMSPLPGRRVVAFPHHSSNFYSPFKKFKVGAMGEYIQKEHIAMGYKHVLLEGHISEPADENGKAKFPNLKVSAPAAAAC